MKLSLCHRSSSSFLLAVCLAGAALGIGCGSAPDWQNQYTETPPEPSRPSKSTPKPEPTVNPCTENQFAPGCSTAESVAPDPEGEKGTPIPTAGNPDPVPWTGAPPVVEQHK